MIYKAPLQWFIKGKAKVLTERASTRTCIHQLINKPRNWKNSETTHGNKRKFLYQLLLDLYSI
jgi:hypothetical protein